MINSVSKTLIFPFLVFFIFFVFYDLNWGAPYYFHPDERNIASSVSQLDLTYNMNPNFFAYGSLPIYTIYFTGITNNFLQNPLNFDSYSVKFEDAIVISRLYSAIFSILIVYLIYKTTGKMFDNFAANISIILSATGVVYLQYSHFGTFEMWLSFFYLLLFYITLQFLKTNQKKFFILLSIVFGITVAIKASSLVLVVLPIISIFSNTIKSKGLWSKITVFTSSTIVFIYLAAIVFITTNPYIIFNTSSFLESMKYESSVALGTLPVFYTGSFVNTIPIIYQTAKILPFLINPLILVLSVISAIFVFYFSLKNKNYYLLLLLVTFLILFVSQSVLFVKWSRYIVPSIAFIYILVSIFIAMIKAHFPRKLFLQLITSTLIFSLFFSFSFISTVRLSKDTRIAAVEFANNNIDREARIISEVYDLGIVPFNSRFTNITLFNFYDLDNIPNKRAELESLISMSDFIILPSQRVVKSRTEKKGKFPQGYDFYSSLIKNNEKFQIVYQTPCDLFCKITYLGDPIYNVEETVNIFDRPTVSIYKILQ